MIPGDQRNAAQAQSFRYRYGQRASHPTKSFDSTRRVVPIETRALVAWSAERLRVHRSRLRCCAQRVSVTSFMGCISLATISLDLESESGVSESKTRRHAPTRADRVKHLRTDLSYANALSRVVRSGARWEDLPQRRDKPTGHAPVNPSRRSRRGRSGAPAYR